MIEIKTVVEVRASAQCPGCGQVLERKMWLSPTEVRRANLNLTAHFLDRVEADVIREARVRGWTEATCPVCSADRA